MTLSTWNRSASAKPLAPATVVAIALCGLMHVTASAQTSYPMVMSLKPIAVQAGTSVECEVQSRYSLRDTHQIFFSGTGVTAEAIPPQEPALKDGEQPKDLTKLKLKITVAPDAALGAREFRLATPRGASTVGQLVIVSDPVVYEQAKNDTLSEAQSVQLPATLCGVIEKNEDSDFWKFHADAGQSLVFHMQSQRLQDKIHDLQTHVDPILFLRDANGSVLAMSDNHFYADPFLSHRFEQAGDYILEIRDVRYTGNVYWEYCVEVHSRPFVTQSYPLAIPVNSTVPVELTGYLLDPAATGTLRSERANEGLQQVAVQMGESVRTNPVKVHVTALPIEAEQAEIHGTAEKAQPMAVPGVMNGRLQKPAEVDVYSLEAKKGEILRLEVLARRYDSQLDSYVRVLNEKGQVLREDDDATFHRLQSSDTLLDNWTVPADGKYFVEVRDVHLRGGDGFHYALQVTRCQPSFQLAIDTDKTNITPGTNGVIFVRAIRQYGFTGKISLDIEGLPPGVFATCGEIQGGKSIDGAIIISAEQAAPLGMSRIQVRGTAEHQPTGATEPQQLVATALPFQEIYMPGGGRSHFAVTDHVVCVGAPSDIRNITVSETDVRLKPGESRKIQIQVERGPDAKANISLDFVYLHLSSIFANPLPEGVTVDKSQSKTLLSGGASEGFIILKADPAAPPTERQLCTVLAHFSINFVMKSTFCSPPIFVSVDAPAK